MKTLDPFLNNRKIMSTVEAIELLESRTAMKPQTAVHALNAIFDTSESQLNGFFDHEDAREVASALRRGEMPCMADQREMLREVSGGIF